MQGSVQSALDWNASEEIGEVEWFRPTCLFQGKHASAFYFHFFRGTVWDAHCAAQFKICSTA